jgi:hypothetical protein
MHQGGALSTAELQQALGAITALQAQLPAVDKLVRSELRVREQQAQAAAAAKAQADAVAAKPKAVTAKQAAAAAAVAKQTAERNRAQQLNSACTAFWTSRGYKSAPWRWDMFQGYELAQAHNWPPLIADMRENGFDYAVQKNLSNMTLVRLGAQQKLKELYNDKNVVPGRRR